MNPNILFMLIFSHQFLKSSGQDFSGKDVASGRSTEVFCLDETTCFPPILNKASWENSEKCCQANGGHLAEFSNAQLVDKLAHFSSGFRPSSVLEFWIGGIIQREDWAWLPGGEPLLRQGCYSTDQSNASYIRDTNNDIMTAKLCVQMCNQLNMKYAAVKAIQENHGQLQIGCACLNDVDWSSPSGGCKIICESGSEKEEPFNQCGGWKEHYVYRVDGLPAGTWAEDCKGGISCKLPSHINNKTGFGSGFGWFGQQWTTSPQSEATPGEEERFGGDGPRPKPPATSHHFCAQVDIKRGASLISNEPCSVKKGFICEYAWSKIECENQGELFLYQEDICLSFHLSRDQQEPWTGAILKCESNGGALLALKDDHSYQYLQNVMVEEKETVLWVALTSWRWQWTTGQSLFNTSFLPWSKDYPTSDTSKSCLTLVITGADVTLENRNCHQPQDFICQLGNITSYDQIFENCFGPIRRNDTKSQINNTDGFIAGITAGVAGTIGLFLALFCTYFFVRRHRKKRKRLLQEKLNSARKSISENNRMYGLNITLRRDSGVYDSINEKEVYLELSKLEDSPIVLGLKKCEETQNMDNLCLKPPPLPTPRPSPSPSRRSSLRSTTTREYPLDGYADYRMNTGITECQGGSDEEEAGNASGEENSSLEQLEGNKQQDQKAATNCSDQNHIIIPNTKSETSTDDIEVESENTEKDTDKKPALDCVNGNEIDAKKETSIYLALL